MSHDMRETDAMMDEIAAVLGEVVELGDSARSTELGEAVRHHVADRPSRSSGNRPNPDVVAALVGRHERCPLCGRGGET